MVGICGGVGRAQAELGSGASSRRKAVITPLKPAPITATVGRFSMDQPSTSFARF
jgi:hypothetical protein